MRKISIKLFFILLARRVEPSGDFWRQSAVTARQEGWMSGLKPSCHSLLCLWFKLGQNPPVLGVPEQGRSHKTVNWGIQSNPEASGASCQPSFSVIPCDSGGVGGSMVSLGIWVALTCLLIYLYFLNVHSKSHFCSHALTFPCPGFFSSKWDDKWKKKREIWGQLTHNQYLVYCVLSLEACFNATVEVQAWCCAKHPGPEYGAWALLLVLPQQVFPLRRQWEDWAGLCSLCTTTSAPPPGVSQPQHCWHCGLDTPHPVCYKSIPDLCLLTPVAPLTQGVKSKLSLDIVQCPLGGKTTPFEDYCL